MSEGKIERVKLTITHTDPPKEYQLGKQVMNLKAKGADGKELRYACFRTSLYEHLKVDKEIDVDVETRQQEVDGDIKTNRSIQQLYIDGQPIGGQAKGQGGGRQWQSKTPEQLALERHSIEWQTTIKASAEFASSGKASPEFLKMLEKVLTARIQNGSVVATMPLASKKPIQDDKELWPEDSQGKPSGTGTPIGADHKWQNIGEMFNHLQTLKIGRPEVYAALELSEKTILIPEKAWPLVFDKLVKAKLKEG